MLRIFSAIGLFVASSFLLFGGISYADSIGYSEARALREAGKILPLEVIIDKAKRFKPGKVIETELEKDDGIYVYEIEILDDWTAPGPVDKIQPQKDACSNASGLTPPRWL